MAKVLVFGANPHYLIRLRGDLISTMVARGHEVVAVTPAPGFEEEVQRFGAKYRHCFLKPVSLNPLHDVRAFFSIRRLMREEQPDYVFAYGIKPVVFGSLAGYLAGCRSIFSMITGLGYAFSRQHKSFKGRLVSSIAHIQYGLALRVNRKVFIQNPDDLHYLTKEAHLVRNEQGLLINGSGVNVEAFYPVTAPKPEFHFLLIARLLWDKGIGEFVEATRRLKQRYPHLRCALVGPLDPNPLAISRDQVERWQKEGVVEYLGETKDVRPFIAKTHAYVLPSYYPEGLPRSILEAMAMGKAIITTDMPGCRETVTHGKNGYLVPARDTEALATAMEALINDAEKVAAMGACSRALVLERFDVRKVNASILNAMAL